MRMEEFQFYVFSSGFSSFHFRLYFSRLFTGQLLNFTLNATVLGSAASGKSLSANQLALSNVRAKDKKIQQWTGFSYAKGCDGVAFGVPSILLNSPDANGDGLPPEEKQKLCDDACEKELENVPMVTTESGLQYKDIKVGGGPTPPVGFQVIKGLDEGILSRKVGGKRRLYIPGPGLISAPGRPRVAPSSPVVFDVSLEYRPGLQDDEE
ncbi:hypothetical protein CRYUN_Cryun40dG0081100 [Craigia yunnanensis]